MIFPFFYRYGFSRNNRIKKIVFLVSLSFISTVYLLFHYASNCPNGHLIIISATYYHESTLYVNDTAAILFNADKHISLSQQWKCISIDASGNSLITYTRPRHAYRAIRECEWSTFIATCPTVFNPISLQLAADEDTSANLPLRLPERESLPVVACFSPFFFNERWQLVALSAESYAAAGVSRQAYYMMSALKDVHDLILAYQDQKVIELHYWTLPRHLEARLQLDWRNQAAAHADCYLKYREAADFIIIADVDDFLYPRQGENLYKELELMAQVRPTTASFFYPRFDTEIVAARNLKNFNLGKSLQSMSISDKRQTGKSIHRTSLVEIPWIHWADLKKNDAPYHKLDPSDNAFIHVRNWSFVDSYDEVRLLNSKIYGYQTNPYYADLNAIMPNTFIPYVHRKFTFRFADHLHNLTSTDIYYERINNCYNEMLTKVARYYQYPFWETLICPTPARCSIGSMPGVKCAVASGSYKTVQLSDNFFVDYLISKNTVEVSESGCTIN